MTGFIVFEPESRQHITVGACGIETDPLITG